MKWLHRFYFAAFLLPCHADPTVENTNIALYDSSYRFQDFNRIRLQSTFRQDRYPDLHGFLAVDNKNILACKGKSNRNETDLYRGYLQYSGEKHLLILGRQRVPLGVGKLWNPIDVFNPVDSFAIEPETRKGTDAVHYEYAVNDLAGFDCTLSEKKSCARLKGFWDFADFALVGVLDRQEERNIIGWEINGELLETGIELTGEGGFFRDREKKSNYVDYVVGAEYGFADSLTLIGEYYRSGRAKTESFGVSATYQLDPLLLIGMRLIVNPADNAGFVTPFLQYGLSDEMTLQAGGLIYNDAAGAATGVMKKQYYLRWFVHF